MPTLTSNLSFNKPLVNNAVDADLWGGQLNDNWDAVDGYLTSDTSVKSSTFTVQTTEFNFLYLADASGGAITANLPAASSVFDGFTIAIKKTDDSNNAVTVDGNSSETIDGEDTYLLQNAKDAVVLVCDGSNWHIKARMVGGRAYNAQTGTSYTFLDSDNGDIVTFSNASAIAVTLPEAGTAGFGAGYFVRVQNLNSGVVTITPTTSTIDGNATATVGNGQTIDIFSDGTNYFTTAIADNFSSQLIHVQDQRTSGTDGGTFTSAAWRTRTLNTALTNEISGASLASNQVTLPAGTYYCEGSAPAQSVQTHATRIQDTTGATTLLSGTSEQASTADSTLSRSFVSGRFVLSTTSDIELQHQCQTTRNTDGFGQATSFAVAEEVYADLKIWKIA